MDANPEKRARFAEPKGFSLGHPPDPDKHFYIDSEDDVRSILEQITVGNSYLIRGPPASGKSTLAQAIRRYAPFSKQHSSDNQSFVLVMGTRMQDMNQKGEILAEFIEQLNDELNLDGALAAGITITNALKFLWQHKVVLVIDEAHVVFEKMYSQYLKDSQTTAIFFTTTPEEVGNIKGAMRIRRPSPPGMAAKFYWSGGIQESVIETALQQTEVKLELEAIRALVQISGVHRGIFNRLCVWVLWRQRAAAVPKVFFAFIIVTTYRYNYHYKTSSAKTPVAPHPHSHTPRLIPRHQYQNHQRHTHTRARTYTYNYHHHTRP